MRALFLALILALSLPIAPALAVQPDEVLSDPNLERRARSISADLRCVVCRNESIDESNAELARDMRLIVRERLVEGDTDAQVVSFLVDRYGEYILLRPRTDGVNLILWVSAPLLFVVALGIAGVALRRRAAPEKPLSPEEEARLREILRD
ncbi:cytochrome c-type biogenesis protein [Pararhodobacter sp. SW119]|uniref:cytochrome c-type biogenesis protein n=1 Tax=Pararhodobacter sp. SW119 TaxID=2780075 RepID=UPI001ADFA127|nr:cytochrome c-type biogenesis protein [Pararhodobacter sp. SW119]